MIQFALVFVAATAIPPVLDSIPPGPTDRAEAFDRSGLRPLPLFRGDPGREQAPVVLEDRWLAEDKLRHFTMSFAVVQMGYGAARFALDHDPALGAAVGMGVALGIGKEVVDRRIGRPFSFRDLAWDAAGVALGAVVARRIN